MADKIQELQADICELRSMLEGATRQRVKDFLSIEIRRIETALVELKEAQAKQVPETATTKLTSKTASRQSTPIFKIRDYAWDQSDKFVKFYVTLKGVHTLDANLVTLEVTSTSCSLKACFPDKIQVFSFENLLHEVLPEKSHHKVKTDMVVVSLMKADESKKWTCVTTAEKQIKAAREAKKMESFKNDPSSTPDPSDGIMQLMKKMYQEGDDDMKRTIAKAWTQAQDKRDTVNMADDMIDL